MTRERGAALVLVGLLGGSGLGMLLATLLRPDIALGLWLVVLALACAALSALERHRHARTAGKAGQGDSGA